MSVLINPFDTAGFSLAEMTQAIQLVPNQYGRLNSLGMFPAEPLSQRIALVEMMEGELRLLPSRPVGSPATLGESDTRTLRSFTVPHVPHNDVVTGHTLLLLDATQSYHREVAKSVEELPEAVRVLLPRVRDPEFTKVLIVSLPEATPTHEASALQDDLRRAGIEPFGWIVNRSFAFSGTQDPVLCAKSRDELVYINEILEQHAQRAVISPWVPQELNTIENLKKLTTYDIGGAV